MKKLWIFSIVLLMLLPLWGSEFERLKALEDSGVQNADLFYNLGVTHWQLGDSGLSVQYFLKALNIDSAHSGAKANMNYVIGLSEDRELYPKHGFLLRLAMQGYDFLNLDRLALTLVILFFIFVLSLSWLLFYDEEKERALPELITGIALLIFLVFALLSGVKYYRYKHNNKAVMIADRADMMTEPREDSRRIAVAHEACILVVEKQEGEWALVRSPDGKSGWVMTQQLGFIKE
ncbi:MAG: hypothetical protein GX106_03645 [Candidatus Cloacimonetes bacterium]|nr:hypothetical protein [Candidatus Cloacimonadota bacterium]